MLGRLELRFITRLVGYVRNIAGMPDYERHVEHLRRFHPERTIPGQRQYYEEYLKARYQDGPTRCC